MGIQEESGEVQKSLMQNLDEVKSSSKVMSEELLLVKEALAKTKQEFLAGTDELKNVTEAHERLKEELAEICKKAEARALDLREEKKVVVSLKKELEESREQNLKEKEAQRDLQRKLEKATKSIDEMNGNALSLSRELETTNSKCANLESQKDKLYESLLEQKDATKKAKDNLEDAQKLLSRLGKEKKSLEKKAEKLEAGLASAKGEILRVRRDITLTKGTISDVENNDAEDSVPVAVKRGGRRRKVASKSEASP